MILVCSIIDKVKFIGFIILTAVFFIANLFIFLFVVAGYDERHEGRVEFAENKVKSILYMVGCALLIFFIIRGYIIIKNSDLNGWKCTWKLFWEYLKGYFLWIALYIPLLAVRASNKSNDLDSLENETLKLLE